jgi:phospholipase C
MYRTPVAQVLRRYAKIDPMKTPICLAAIVLALSGCGGGANGSQGSGSDAGATKDQGTAAGSGSRASSVPRFSHVVVIVFENKGYDEVIGESSAPTFNRLAARGALLTDYLGVARPSLPNYLALISGSTHDISENCTDCAVNAPNLADTLEASGKTWKSYAEDLPFPGFTGGESGGYAKKHNPFVYFDSVTSNPARLARVVGFDQFRRDLAARSLPDFSLVVPNQCNSMHDCPVSTGDAWLKRLLPPLLDSPQLERGVVFVIFDEGEESDDAGGGGHIPALAAAPTVRTGSRSTQALTHYSLLRTIEDAWDLPHLGKSGSTAPISGIWR